MKSGNNRERAAAALASAEMLNSKGDLINAERAYESAVESGVPEIVPVAAFGLGMLREASGNLDGAISAFRITAASDHGRFAADADNAIGDLLLKAGDRAAARAAYRKAAECTGDHVAAARARLRIAQLDYGEGKRDAAKNVMEALARSSPKAVALASAFSLGQLLAAEGKIDDASRTLKELLQSGDPTWIDKANRELRKLQQH